MSASYKYAPDGSFTAVHSRARRSSEDNRPGRILYRRQIRSAQEGYGNRIWLKSVYSLAGVLGISQFDDSPCRNRRHDSAAGRGIRTQSN